MYIAESVLKLNKLYEDIIHDRSIQQVSEQLRKFANRLFEAYRAKLDIALVEISNWHPACIGCKTFDSIPQNLDKNDIQLTIAKAYHYPSWADVLNSEDQFDWTFEEAIDCMLEGDFDHLEELLTAYPYLTEARSSYGHRAGLIHYVGSNGVEMWRQKVPNNLLEITKNLVAHGADPEMESRLYGGCGKVIGLIESSAHPKDAGIQGDLLALFRTFSI